MILNKAIFLAALLSVYGCSSLSKSATSHRIGFSDIQKVQMGYTHTSDLEKLFGQPNEVVTDENKQKFWIYKDYVDSTFSDRAKFRIDPATGIVMGAIWSPDETTGYSTEKELLSGIKSGKFTCKLFPSPKDRHYEASSDGSCYNPKVGLSYIFIGRERGIYAIAFSVPQETRIPAQMQKTK